MEEKKVYVFHLANNRFYISYTKDLEETSDFLGKDDILNVSTEYICTPQYIFTVMVQFMKKYGFQNVRSSVFPNTVPSEEDLDRLINNYHGFDLHDKTFIPMIVSLRKEAHKIDRSKIYVYRFHGDFYYISFIGNLEHEMKRSTWLRRQIFDKVTVFNANNPYSIISTTFIYMEKYGYDKVRGSILPDREEGTYVIKKIMDGLGDSCIRCGRYGHYHPQCLEERSVNRVTLKCQICENNHSLKHCPTLAGFTITPK